MMYRIAYSRLGGRKLGAALLGLAGTFTTVEAGAGELPVLSPGAGSPADWYGFSIDVDNDIAVVGAARDDANGKDAGAVYVYRKTDGI